MKKVFNKKIMRKRIYSFLRLVLGLLIIYLLIKSISFSEILRLYNSIYPLYILYAAILYIFDRLIVDYRWNYLLKSKGIYIPLYKIIEISLIGQFIGKFLPSALAPDAIRAYGLSKEISDSTESISSVLVDRFISFFPLLMIAILGTFLSFGMQENANPKLLLSLLIIFIVILMIGLFILFSGPLLEKLFSFNNSGNNSLISRNLSNFYKSVYEFKRKKHIILMALFFSFVAQVLRSLIAYFSALALNVDINIFYFFAFIPAISLILMVPTTLGGLGVAEGAYIYFFSQVGMLSHEAFALCLIQRVLTIATILIPGGIIYIIKAFRMRKFVFNSRP